MNACGKLLACVTAALLPQLSSAASCNAIICRAPISNLYLNGDAVLVQLGITESQKSTINCTLVSNLYFVLRDSNARFKEIYAALLSAQARGTDVSLRIVEGSADCQVVWAMAWS
jgi:hypothetical protein